MNPNVYQASKKAFLPALLLISLFLSSSVYAQKKNSGTGGNEATEQSSASNGLFMSLSRFFATFKRTNASTESPVNHSAKPAPKYANTPNSAPENPSPFSPNEGHTNNVILPTPEPQTSPSPTRRFTYTPKHKPGTSPARYAPSAKSSTHSFKANKGNTGARNNQNLARSGNVSSTGNRRKYSYNTNSAPKYTDRPLSFQPNHSKNTSPNHSEKPSTSNRTNSPYKADFKNQLVEKPNATEPTFSSTGPDSPPTNNTSILSELKNSVSSLTSPNDPSYSKPTSSANAPLDGGLSVLLLAGAAVGMKKAYEKRKKATDKPE